MEGIIRILEISHNIPHGLVLSGKLLESCTVTFSSYMNTNNIISANGDIYFDKFLLDKGNAFASDEFTAPINGVYQFSSMCGKSAHLAGISNMIAFFHDSVIFLDLIKASSKLNKKVTKYSFCS